MSQKQYAKVTEVNGIPRFSEALPLAAQHVVAMIVGCVTPAIILSGVTGLSASDQVRLIQASPGLPHSYSSFHPSGSAAQGFPLSWAPALPMCPC